MVEDCRVVESSPNCRLSSTFAHPSNDSLSWCVPHLLAAGTVATWGTDSGAGELGWPEKRRKHSTPQAVLVALRCPVPVAVGGPVFERLCFGDRFALLLCQGGSVLAVGAVPVPAKASAGSMAGTLLKAQAASFAEDAKPAGLVAPQPVASFNGMFGFTPEDQLLAKPSAEAGVRPNTLADVNGFLALFDERQRWNAADLCRGVESAEAVWAKLESLFPGTTAAYRESIAAIVPQVSAAAARLCCV